ncbi:unnamed protein product [Musa acuminata var. zebrina]
MSPRVTAFSSRGPSILFPDLVKPDITAPGFLILAAVKDSYKFESGTSMSCPHVSGVAALLKAAHPQWSPAAIKSALVTTAHTANAYGFPIEAEGVPRKHSDPFDFGGGHIDPNKAVDPGLIYDVDPEDYFKFFNCTYGPSTTCDLVDSRLYHLNLPSISIPDLKKRQLTVWRTVINVGDTDSIYRAKLESPSGVNMVVEPSLLQFNASTTTHTFAAMFTPLQMVQGDFNFGSLTWLDDGKHAVRIPIAVLRCFCYPKIDATFGLGCSLVRLSIYRTHTIHLKKGYDYHSSDDSDKASSMFVCIISSSFEAIAFLCYSSFFQSQICCSSNSTSLDIITLFVIGSSIVYSYKHGFSGFAAMLTESQAHQIAELPEVISVNPSRSVPLHTTRSWDYLGLGYEKPQSTGLLRRGNFGDGIIIGVVDSGKRIWPESRSFDDHGYGPVPSRWKGTCQVGQNFTIKHCNRKIIGARWYDRGVDDSDISVDYRSPRDFQGHGTHTASTAAGSFVGNASFHGLGAGVARGGAPRARLAIYKACWAIGGCPDAAVLKAIDDVIHDGVDILSLSLGGLLHPIFPSIHAVAKGITVIFSGGNDGPVTQTIANDLPWVITVAASTIDRSFPTDIILGNGRTLVGQSMCYASSDPGYKELVVIDSCSVVPQYLTQLADKIVLCFDRAFAAAVDAAGETSLLLAGLTQAGARGAIIARFPRSLLPDCSGIACVLVDYDVGGQIANYAKVENARIPVVRVSPASNIVGNQVMSPRVAAFSSRGPSIYYPDLVKPDITAPGVDILAAVRDGYQFMSGTSMACPHVSGIAALLKVVHPHWSPAAIKSALVTTAHTANAYGFPIEAEGVPRKLADPFDFGGGHIDPNKAADPGLIYDVDPEDYFKIFISTYARSITCGLLDSRLYHLNLPSISIPDLKKTPLTVWRTVTNVGDTDSIYRAMVESPPGVNTVVEPSLLLFNASTTTHTFAVTFTPLMMVQGDFNFGSLTWFDDGKHAVRIPIAVRVIIHDFFSDTS